MYLTKEKKLEISNKRSDFARRIEVDITDDGIKKGCMVFCKFEELTNVIDALTELRDLLTKETGFRF